MKIYLLVPFLRREALKQELEVIVQELKSKGHKVNDEVLKIEPTELQEEETDVLQNHKDVMNKIKSSDAIIAEVTYASSGIGFLIATALNENKHVLALSKELPETRALPIRAAKSKNLTFQKYNLDNVKNILNDFCTKTENNLDTKFILIISPSIDKYLKWASDEYRMHKAQIVRDSIEATMSKDKEYKKFQKDSSL